MQATCEEQEHDDRHAISKEESVKEKGTLKPTRHGVEAHCGFACTILACA